MRDVRASNDHWTFHEGFDDGLTAAIRAGEAVRLPQTAVELPLNYFDEAAYQRRFTYQKIIAWDDAYDGREVSLVFDGTMAGAVLARAGLGASPLAPLFWPAFALTVLSLVANAASPSRPERLLWTPVIALMAAAALGVGIL